MNLDWISELTHRGLLTPEQAEDVRRCDPAPLARVDPIPGAAKPFGRYRLLRELGHGGMGIVWEAFDTVLCCTVALKMLRDASDEHDAELVAGLVREAKMTMNVRHPGVVNVLEIGEAEGRHYFAMELIAGKSFEHLLRHSGSSDRLKIEIVAAVAEALGAVHAEGILHGDIKPSNILLDSQDLPVLIDFGLARASAPADNALAMAGSLFGTLDYMSPEQAWGTPSAALPPSDIFSLGVVLFRALTDRFPFVRNDETFTTTILHEAVPMPSSILPDISPALDTICLKCLERAPERRYRDGAALAVDLRRWLAGNPELRPVPGTRRSLLRFLDVSQIADVRNAAG